MKKVWPIVLLIISVLIILVGILTYIFFMGDKKMDNTNTNNEPTKEIIDNKPKEENNVDKLKKENYFIAKNLDRYLNYLKMHPEKDMTEIIRCVNANIDYEFYTNTVNSNTDDDILLIVNKYHRLSSNYVPKLVEMDDKYNYNKGYRIMHPTAYEHFKEMVDAAKKDGIVLFNVSAYRSYDTQYDLYNEYVKNHGKEAADTFSARPGYSEHQTGLTTDINTSSSKANFENSKEYAWLIENSYKYGFILRYPKDKEYLTGYKYEPWHYRYVGKDVAKYIYENDITYEEYYAYFIDNK